MIITISGRAGSGKSTAAKMLAKTLHFKHYSIGDLQRELAKEKGITILELNKLEETDTSIDKELDNKQKMLGNEQDDFVIDGRLSAHFIPHATLKIFLDANEILRAQRIFAAKRDAESHSSLQKVIAFNKARERSESKRYQQYYKYDCYDLKNYDIVIDTTGKTPEEVLSILLKKIPKQK